HRPHLHPSPTRRSSDLAHARVDRASLRGAHRSILPQSRCASERMSPGCASSLVIAAVPRAFMTSMLWPLHEGRPRPPVLTARDRSEEHTSELQSPYDLV